MFVKSTLLITEVGGSLWRVEISPAEASTPFERTGGTESNKTKNVRNHNASSHVNGRPLPRSKSFAPWYSITSGPKVSPAFAMPHSSSDELTSSSVPRITSVSLLSMGPGLWIAQLVECFRHQSVFRYQSAWLTTTTAKITTRRTMYGVRRIETDSFVSMMTLSQSGEEILGVLAGL